MKKLFVMLSCTLLILSCNNTGTSSSKSLPLFIKTTDVTGVDEKQIKKETISQVKDEYFECEMSKQTNGGYHVQKDLVIPTSSENFKFVFYTIVDEKKDEIHFMTSAEFLNYMSARAYEMVLEIPQEYGNAYRFKKKAYQD